MEKILGLLSGIVPCIILVVLGIIVLKTNKPQNVATWFMWSILDLIITISMFAAGNIEAWLPAGFTIGEIFLTIILIKKGKWHWGFTELICAVGSVATMTLWYFSSMRWAVVCSCLAMWIASVPIVRDTWKFPDRTIWWFWGFATVSAAIALAVAKSWQIEDYLFPLSSAIFNFLMTFLIVRGFWVKRLSAKPTTA